MKRRRGKFSGHGLSPNNPLSRELTKAKHIKMNLDRRKKRQPVEILLKPAEYVPERILIKKQP